MTSEQKSTIQWKLNNYVAGFPSQKQAANSLKDCSEATVVNILSGKWQDIADKMWQNIAGQLGQRVVNTPIVETQNFQTLILYFSLAKENGATFALVGGAGYGKTFAGKFYSNANRNKSVYYLECAEYWNKKTFLISLLQSMGKPFAGMNCPEMMQYIVSELRRQYQPVIILDEIDKLSDPVLKFFITLYNELNGVCGFVWTSTDNIEKRLRKGLNTNRNGYQELFSRIGQRFILLPCASVQDIREICLVNGINKEEDIARISNECNGDLRRVERNLLKNKILDKQRSMKKAA